MYRSLNSSIFILGIYMFSGIVSSLHAGSPLNSRESKNIVSLHNSYRKAVGVGNLKYGKKESTSALKWANDLESRSCPLEHSGSAARSGYGENIYIQWSNGIRLKIEDAVRGWGDEQLHYNYQTNSCAEGEICGHYTQMVWKNTTNVGCAKALCFKGNEKTEILVCQYNPAGNYMGSFPY